jgi:hypothetical protein
VRRALIPLLVLAAVLSLAVVAGSSAKRAQDRPDLKVTKGSGSVSGGQLTGSFTLRNKGDARAKRSKALLTVRAPGQDAVAERFQVAAIDPGATYRLDFAVPVPSGLPDGALPVVACADSKGKLRERKENNNCATVGSILIGDVGGSTPTDPISFEKEAVFTLDSPASRYWVFVPASYDEAHNTPTSLLVWMHGCGGTAEGDIFTVSPGGSQDWISIAIGGKEGGCWDPAGDQPKIFEAVADMKTHFNIASRRVVLGGYSSGGDISYRTAFYNSASFAGLLVVDSTPFRDTGSSQADSLAAATTKFNVVHLAHLQDTTYPIATVRSETEAMKSAGFPIQRIEAQGEHYNNPGDVVNGQQVPGTDADIQNRLLPHMADGWLAPAQ